MTPRPADPLRTYRDKRRFDETAEPAGTTGGRARRGRRSPKAPRFVVQEHSASAMHWDFRLERDGVLVSWAVPKGLPPEPGVSRLAIHVEDHPLDYIDFAGDIPEGSYGGGHVEVWDSGTYECDRFDEKHVEVTLHGDRVEGSYLLVRTRGKQWLLRRLDPPQDATREPMPGHVEPMRPRHRRQLPDEVDGAGWACEVLWRGVRTIVRGEGGRIELATADGTDVTAAFPEVARMGRDLGSRQVLLDAVLVAFDEAGRVLPDALERRLEGSASAHARKRESLERPATLVVVDLLFEDGHPLLELPLRERRRRLEGLGIDGANWTTSDLLPGAPAAVLAAVGASGLPGIVAKRLDAPYVPGRTAGWVSVRASR